MYPVLKTFRAAKLGSTAVWTLSVAALASVLGSGVSNAGVVACPTDPITSAGSDTVETPTNVGPACIDTTIAGDQTFPGYWEFTWNGSNGPATIGASVDQSSNSFQGDLALYDTSDNLLESATMAGSFTGGDPATATLDFSFTQGTQYIVGIETPGLTASEDPPFSVTFTSTPEPASIGLFGGALAALGWLRGRRRRQG